MSNGAARAVRAGESSSDVFDDVTRVDELGGLRMRVSGDEDEDDDATLIRDPQLIEAGVDEVVVRPSGVRSSAPRAPTSTSSLVPEKLPVLPRPPAADAPAIVYRTHPAWMPAPTDLRMTPHAAPAPAPAPAPARAVRSGRRGGVLLAAVVLTGALLAGGAGALLARRATARPVAQTTAVVAPTAHAVTADAPVAATPAPVAQAPAQPSEPAAVAAATPATPAPPVKGVPEVTTTPKVKPETAAHKVVASRARSHAPPPLAPAPVAAKPAPAPVAVKPTPVPVEAKPAPVPAPVAVRSVPTPVPAPVAVATPAKAAPAGVDAVLQQQLQGAIP